MSESAAATSNNVYIKDPEYAWLPGHIISSTATTATVRCQIPSSDSDSDSDSPHTYKYSASSALEERDVEVKLSDYAPSNALPLQNVDENGVLMEVADMVDLSFLHEAAILYNLKARHGQGVPYTRTGDIIIAVNPYQWIDGLYSNENQYYYGQHLIWNQPSTPPPSSTTTTKKPLSSSSNDQDGNDAVDPRAHIDPHVYETSSLAYRGLACDAVNQSILVSGESGAGKTETVKILLSHIALVQGGGIRPSEEEQGAIETAPSTTSSSSNMLPSNNEIIKRVLDSNPLLEAFGNAKTVRNDNSSRFGKYIELQFDCESPHVAALQGKRIPSAVLAGSRCVTYLLEKSRVVLHDVDAERGFHIFYQLLASPEEYKVELWEGLENTDTESFKYVGYSDTDVIEGLSDEERWFQTVEALQTIGIEGDTLTVLMRAICTVLQLGNLIFEPDPDNEEASMIVNEEEELHPLADIMGMEVEDIKKALTIRTVTAKAEVYKVPLNAHAAKDCCDAFAKEIYARAFDWLVRKINEATSAELNYKPPPEKKVARPTPAAAAAATSGKTPIKRRVRGTSSTTSSSKPAKKKFGIIGLLDIFGFESFEVNRFEQICINYANEKLQQKFTLDIFRSVQAEYDFEGIELGEVAFEDNANVLKLIEGRMGLISVLNEECVRPRGNDVAFVSKINAVNKDNEILVQDKFYRDYEFGIQHYAGLVVYNSNNFVKKNMDALPGDLEECAKKCTNELIRTELLRKSDNVASASGVSPGTPKPKGRGGRGGGMGGGARTLRKQSSGTLVSQTVSTKFKNQLHSLMANIGETRSRYIRCIKPNREKEPLKMEHLSTVAQLRCAGVVAAVTISRSAFPNRLELDLALERFSCVPSEDGEEDDVNIRDRVERLLTLLFAGFEAKKKDGTSQTPFLVGKTRIYFRAGALEYLESQRLTALSDRAVLLQTLTRMYMARSKYVAMRKAAVKIQSRIRWRKARTRYLTMKKASVLIQCWIRCNFAATQLVQRREAFMAVKLQTRWRVAVAMTMRAQHIRATIRIQAMARGSRQRPIYRKMLADAIEEAKIENQLKTLQQKLEEAEAKRIEAEKRAAQTANSPQRTVVVYRDGGGGEEKKNDAQNAQAPQLNAQQVQLSAQQQTLIDESGKMLEYLRKEVFKLRTQNSQLRKDFDLLRENNQRLMDSNASAGASFAALNQHAKQLNRTNAKLMADLQGQKQVVSRLHLVQTELKEELKMKQSTYIAEVQSRLTYQKAMGKMVELIAKRCRDGNLVEDVIAISEGCELDFLGGSTGATPPPPKKPPSSPRNQRSRTQQDPTSPSGRNAHGQTSLSGRVWSLFGYGAQAEDSPPPSTKEELSGLEAFSGNYAEM